MFDAVSEVLLAFRKSRESYDPEHKAHGSDRRVFHRVPLAIEGHLINPAFGLEAPCTTINISLDGLGATARVNWSEGNRIQVRFDWLSNPLDAVVVFRKQDALLFRYGIQFQQLSFYQIIKLRRFLKRHYDGFLSL